MDSYVPVDVSVCPGGVGAVVFCTEEPESVCSGVDVCKGRSGEKVDDVVEEGFSDVSGINVELSAAEFLPAVQQYFQYQM